MQALTEILVVSAPIVRFNGTKHLFHTDVRRGVPSPAVGGYSLGSMSLPY
jgi:hypothetical protein